MLFDVITIGAATRDAFIKSKYFKLLSSPEFISGEGLCLPAGAKIDVEDIVFATGGGATNAAVTFARQGFKTAALCRIGEDVSGREVLADLNADDINTGYVICCQKEKTAYSMLILSESGERTVLVYRGASENIEPADISKTVSAKWFYLSGALDIKVVERVLKIAGEASVPVAFNPANRELKLGLGKLKDILGEVNVLILNREEGAYLTKIDYRDESRIFKKLDEYVKGMVVLTDGQRGALVSDGRTLYRAGVYPEQKVMDKTGAGDAFGSGFVAGLIKTNNIECAFQLASANATSVVEKIGAKPGILSAKDFTENARWRRGLKISKENLSL